MKKYIYTEPKIRQVSTTEEFLHPTGIAYFAHRSPLKTTPRWTVTENSTGIWIARAATRNDALNAARRILDGYSANEVRDVIQNVAQRLGKLFPVNPPAILEMRL